MQVEACAALVGDEGVQGSSRGDRKRQQERLRLPRSRGCVRACGAVERDVWMQSSRGCGCLGLE